MSGRTGIQWTDSTWNPVVGCTKVSQGCKHCYAKVQWDRRHRAALAGKRVSPQYARPFEKVELLADRLDQPLRWRTPRRIFVNSVSDAFHEQLSDDQIVAVLAAIAAAGALGRGHVFQVLTKRPARMRALLAAGTAATWAARLGDAATTHFGDEIGCHVTNSINGVLGAGHNVGWPLANLWLGTSVEDQKAADERIPELRRTPAAVRFLSCEPLLGALNIRRFFCHSIHCPAAPHGGDPHSWAGSSERCTCPRIHWVIGGGESGPGFRAAAVEWARDLRDQCVTAGVAFFWKQWGGRTSKSGGRELDGRTWDEMPAAPAAVAP